MSSSHRKRKGRARSQVPADEPRQRKPKAPDERARAPELTGAQLPPIEVPFIGPPRRKPSRKPSRPSPDERPAMPPGALVSLTVSGGFAFSQRELVVYDDGRMTYATLGAGRGQSQRASHLSEAQMSAVRDELAKLQPRAFAGRATPPPPDAYAYEIAARVGGEMASTTVSTGFIPPELASLLRMLRDLAQDD